MLHYWKLMLVICHVLRKKNMELGSWKKLHRHSQKPLGKLGICIGKWQGKNRKGSVEHNRKIMLVPNLELSLKCSHLFLCKCKDLVCYSTTGIDVLRSSLVYIWQLTVCQRRPKRKWFKWFIIVTGHVTQFLFSFF